MARRSPKPATQAARRTRKTTPAVETPPVVDTPAVETVVAAKPKSQDPKKANLALWLRAKETAHARIAELSRHLCACGCGRECRNTFAPGHDAQLQSRIANELFTEWLTSGDMSGLVEVLDPRPDAEEEIPELDELTDGESEAE